MANNITEQEIVAEAVRIAHNKSAFLKKVNRDYEEMFMKPGMKPGDTIYVRKANQFTIRSGAVANIQDVNEAKIPVTIQPEIGIDIAFSEYDLALKLDKFTERYIEPAAKKLASAIDRIIASTFYAAVNNAVGTPGTPPTTQQGWQALFLKAKTKLANAGAPIDEDNWMVLDPLANESVVSYLNNGFNNQRIIGEQYRTGMMDEALGWKFHMSQNAPSHTVGPLGGTPLVNGANQGLINTGATDNPRGETTSLTTDGWTAAAAARLKKGDIITLAGVFDVNAETKQVLPNLKQFTVTADVSSAADGTATVIVSPAIVAGTTSATSAYQNVSNRPADDAAITVLGTANTTYSQALGYHKDAFTFVTIPMELPKGMDMAAQESRDGLTMRFVRGYDILNNRRISRFDILAGYAAIQPEWAVRVFTA